MEPDTARPRHASTRSRLVLACIGVLLAAADTYVVVLALPDIMVGVGLDIDELQRATPVISGFLLGYIAVLPLIGRLSDLFGRPPVLVASLLLFGFGSLLTAASYDLTVVVVGRFLQGVGGGGLVPATLALVADLWPPHRRGLPLGVVGAVQELGSVLGPLLGAAILALADWRMIFWVNLACALVLAAGFRRRRSPDRSTNGGRDLPGLALGLLAVVALTLTLTAPERLTSDITLGLAFLPVVGESRWTAPIGLATVVLTAGFVVRELTAARPILPLRRLPALARAADVVGAALLGLALGGVVVTFAVADRAFVVRQRRTARPVVPRDALTTVPAWGSLVVSLFTGAALIVALVDVPIFARATTYPDSQLGAAMVLVRFLVALPVGAVLGGWLSRRCSAALLTAVGMAVSAVAFVAMAGWRQDALDGLAAQVALVVGGMGFGLAIAPVNAALLMATRSDVHGVASALLVVARMVGMLVGLSALTAVGLHRFFERQEQIPPPAALCPESPAQCPAYVDALRDAALVQLHTTFAGAAVCAATAGVVALVTLRRTAFAAPRTSAPAS